MNGFQLIICSVAHKLIKIEWKRFNTNHKDDGIVAFHRGPTAIAYGVPIGILEILIDSSKWITFEAVSIVNNASD